MKAWDHFLHLQQTEIGQETVNKWLRTLRIVKFDAGNLYLEARDAFHAMWFEEHVRHKLQTHLFNNNGRRIKVHLSIAGQSESQERPRRSTKKAAQKAEETPSFSLAFDELDPYCTFENIVIDESNELALKLLQEMVEHGSSDFNPVYLYGNSSVGKTHLLMATAHGLKKQGRRVLYARGETFTEHVVKAIRAGEMKTFREAYRNTEVLLIDDVHILARKGATQEELFHTFNTLHTAGKQIVLTAHSTPQELQYIEPRLISRFEWGVVLPVEPLSQEKVEEVLLKKAAALDFTLSGKVIKFLLETFSSGTMALIRALEALVLRSHIHRGERIKAHLPLTVAVVENLLSDLIQTEKSQALTAEKIISTVAEFYGIRSEDILGKSQNRECVLPRQVAMYLCRFFLKTPYMKIGDLFGRDHSTVMSSIKHIKKSLHEEGSDIAAAVNAMIKKLRM